MRQPVSLHARLAAVILVAALCAGSDAASECCTVLTAPSHQLLQCVNTSLRSSAPHSLAVHVLSQAGGADTVSYAAYSVLLNALWATQQRYGYFIAADVQLPPTFDPRFAKVWIIAEHLDATEHSGPTAPQWLLWLDADAVVVKPDWRAESLALAHASEETHLLACDEASLQTNTRLNSGALLVRPSAWSRAFFRAWWEHPDAARGATDQEVFDALWNDNFMGVQERVVVLHANAFNTEPPAYISHTADSPVLHLAGYLQAPRVALFAQMAAVACTGRIAGGSMAHESSAAWPPTADWLRSRERELHEAIVAAGRTDYETEVAIESLAILCGSEGLIDEQAALWQKLLVLREEQLSVLPDDMIHTLQELGESLSLLERHADAESFLLRALALAEALTDLGGKPQFNTVASVHGRLGMMHARARNWRSAVQHMQASLTAVERLRGPQSIFAAHTHFNLGVIFQRSGDCARARDAYAHAQLLFVEFGGPSHAAVADAQRNAALCVQQHSEL